MHLTFPSAQVNRLERVNTKLEEANEDAVRERLHRLAAEENPSGAIKSICRKKYSRRGQQKVEIDAAVTINFPNSQPPLAYVAERKRTLTLTAFDEVEDKWAAIRWVPVFCAFYAGLNLVAAKPSPVCLTKRLNAKASTSRSIRTSACACLLSLCLLINSQCMDFLNTR